MPLPSQNTAWPPADLQKIRQRMSEWSAWYSGDPDELGRVYGRPTSGPQVANRPSQYRGGVVGSVARWFWGQPLPTGQSQVTKLHVPIASDLAVASSDLLFAEQPTINTEDGEKAKRERLDTILEENSWESLLPESGEVAAALGGVYLRVTWDTEVSSQPIITTVHADAAIPEFKFGRLQAVTFWQILKTEGTIVVRHLERHEKGRIEHGLFVGTSDNLGKRVPLTDHPTTAGITLDDDTGITTGTERLTVAYVPNIRPNRIWRNQPAGTNLGRSDFSGVEGPMDSLDEVYTSWMRDVRLGKARIMAPQYMLETQGRGEGAALDLDREVFVGLNMAPGGDSDTAQLTVKQFEIRADDHEATIKGLLERIISGAGYSLQTFGLNPAEGGATTATEIASRERKSMTTREKKTRYWSPALVDILQATMDIDKSKFSGPGSFEKLTIEFAPSVQPTQLDLAMTAQALRTAKAASTRTLVAMVHPDWDPKTIDEEAAKILGEDRITIPDFGLPTPEDQLPVDDTTGDVGDPA